MVLFKEQDMLKYMSDLGQTVTTVEIERDYELPFIEGNYYYYELIYYPAWAF